MIHKLFLKEDHKTFFFNFKATKLLKENYGLQKKEEGNNIHKLNFRHLKGVERLQNT